MKNGFRLALNFLVVVLVTLAPITQLTQVAQALGTSCATSSPQGGTYSATICIGTPVDGAALSGDATVTATVSVSAPVPGVQRVVFYLDGNYLLTDYETPYTFSMPTAKWTDGTHALSAEALLRDTFVTQRAIVNVSFNNGITATPVNPNKFTPTTGRPAPTGTPFIVAAGGDGASGEASAQKVSDLVTSLNPNLFLYLGDVYEKGSPAEFYNWYGTPATNFDRLRSITDPTVGNHEYTAGKAPGYFDYWDNIPSYYSYTTNGWHFISLNSNASAEPATPLSAQYKWLQKDLAAHTTRACTIVYYHHPLFDIGPEGATTSMADIWKLLAQYGVDIVVNGHDHDYQRWMPLDANGQPSAGGITEFVVGSAGHGLQTIANSDPRVVYSNSTNPTAFGVLLLQLNKAGANFKYVNTDGAVLDSGVVPCVGGTAPDTTAPTVPAAFNAVASSGVQADLSWTASTDATGVAGYTVYRDGVSIATAPSSSVSYSDQTAVPRTTYAYTIDAFDAAGNHSAKTAPVTVTTPSMPTTMTFPAAADTYVSAAAPASSFGTAVVLRVGASPDLHDYLRFNVSGLGGRPIVKARLMLFPNSNGAQGISASAVADNSWSETTVNYSTAPALGGPIGSSGPFVAGNWATIDVTPNVTGEGLFSFGITTTGTSALSLASRESGANAPQLVLDFVANGPDAQPPTMPPSFAATAGGPTQVNLSWGASTDNVDVLGYTLYRNGAVLTTVPGATRTYSDTSVSALSTNAYSVDAFDPTGNHSPITAAVSVTTPTLPSTLTLLPVADSYVNGAALTTNYGTKAALRVDALPDVRSYLRFSVPSLSGSTITGARLLIYPKSNTNQGLAAWGVADNSWTEKGINYSNAPALGSALASSGKSLAGTWVSLNITPYITGQGTYNLAVTTPSTTATGLAARESGATSPQLVLNLQVNNTDSQPPTVPAGLSALATTPGQVALSWSAASDNVAVAGYTLYRDGTVIGTAAGASLTYTDTNAAFATTYHYSIDAFDAAGNHSPVSALVPVVTTDPPPSVPTGLTAIIIGGTQVSLTWAASTDNLAVDGYTIYRNGSEIGTVTATNLSYVDSTIVSGSTYAYSIDAFDQFGNHSASTAPVQATPPDTTSPTTPGGLTAAVIGPAQVDLTWTASTDNVTVAGYTVYRDGTAIATLPAASLAYSDKLALANATFHYTVDAFDSAGNHSGQSASAAATTPPMPPSITLTPEADTYVSAATASTSFGSNVSLRADSSPDLHSYLRFNVQLLGGAPITRARLLLFATAAGTQGISAQSVSDNSWSEATTSFANAPLLGSPIASSGPYATGTWVTVDVTPYITGEGIYSIGITTPGAAALSFASRETGANAPQLVLDLQNNGPDVQPPMTPIGLTASATSATQVDLSWPAAVDNVAVTGYTIYRNGASIATVPATALTYSDKTALPKTSYDYTVDAFDAAGNHSDPTDPATVLTPNVPPSVTIAPDADTYVNAGSPASNFGTGTSLRTSSSPDLHAYLRFTVQGLGGTPIGRARLLVFANSASTLGITAQAVSDNTWGELTTTYASAPALGSAIGSSGQFAAAAWTTVDVTSYVTGDGTYSFGITTPGTTSLNLASRESGANAPQLVLDLQNGDPDVQAPSSPTLLAATPSSPSQVDLSWTAATDNKAVTGYTVYRDGTSVATLSPSSLTYSDKTASAQNTYIYSVDAFDQAGNHSAPSVPVSASTPNAAASLTFAPDADTYVAAATPASNFGKSASLRMSSSPDQHAYLRFTVQGLGGVPISRARLMLFANSNGTAGISAASVADNTWGELTTVYTGAPALGSALASSGAFTTGNWVALDVTSYVTAEGAYSFGITTPGVTSLNLASRESGANAPQLVLDLQNGDPDAQPPSVPTGLAAVASNATTVNLTWSAASDNFGVTGYTVYRDGAVLTTLPAASLTYSDTSASSGHTYSYAVDAFDLAGNHSAASIAVSATTPDTVAPSTPGSLTATVSSATQVDLSWAASTDNVAVTAYTIYRDGAVLTSVLAPGLTYSDTSVIAGHTYNYSVDAVDQAGNRSPASATVPATSPDGQAPSAPAGLSASASGPTQVDLSWTAAADNVAVTGYTVYRDGSSIATLSGTSLTYSDKSALPKTTYAYTVDAFDQAGNHSPASSQASATTPNVPASVTFAPDADTYVSASSATSNFGHAATLRAGFSPDLHSYLRFTVQGLGGTPITRARLLIFANTNGSQGISAVSVADNSWGETTMNFGNAPSLGSAITTSAPFTTGNWVVLDVTSYVTGPGTYSFAITSTGASAISLASREAAANAPQLVLDLQNGDADTQPPSTPTGLVAALNGSSRVDLSWAAASDNLGVAGYTIYRNSVALTTVPGTALAYSDSSVLPGNTYSYTVDAFDQAGNHSAVSTAASATAPDNQAPTVPSALAATVASATRVNLSWTASTDNVAVNGYTIYRDGVSIATVIGTTLSYADKTALPATTYSYTVDAFDKAGNHSAPTSPVSASTPDPAPSVPTGLTAVASSTTQVDLSWSASTDNLAVAGYTVYRDGSVLTSVGGSTLIFSDTTVVAGHTYAYSVDAFDQPGSHSAASAAVSVTTPDTVPPTTPAGLAANGSGPNKVDLSWTAASDNVAVTGYSIYRDGNLVGTVAGSVLTYSDLSVAPATTYNYSVDSFDQAGNHSPASGSVPVTTPAAPTGITFAPAADTYVNASSATSNFGKSTALRAAASPDQHAYLRFVVQGLGGNTIARVRLMLFANSNGSQGINAVSVADNTWGELTTTYSNAPALGGTLASSGPFTTGNWVTLDVTAYVTGEGTFSFAITTAGTSSLNLSSREAAANAPQLIIDFH